MKTKFEIGDLLKSINTGEFFLVIETEIQGKKHPQPIHKVLSLRGKYTQVYYECTMLAYFKRLK